MLAPHWFQPRIGPLLRGGIDYRAYVRQILLLGLFRPRHDEVSGWRRWAITARAHRVIEPDHPAEQVSTSQIYGSDSRRPIIVTFLGLGRLLSDLTGYEVFLLSALRAMTRPQWLAVVNSRGAPTIGINIRMGNDFQVARSPEDYFAKGAIKTPLEWYMESLAQVRKAVGGPARAIVVSDGVEQALAPILAQENVEFARPGCAISDLLTLAQCKVLIGSGGSSFSAWAAFLGQMPVITHPGQSLSWFGLSNRPDRFIGTFDPSAPDHQFMEQVSTVLTSRWTQDSSLPNA